MAASDYESDAAYYMESHGDTVAASASVSQLPHQTNTDLNLSVLRRYEPSIRSIVSIAANAVVYNFSPETQGWDKSGVEGTLFVCQQEPFLVTAAGSGGPGTGIDTETLPRTCIFVLNRRGLNNLIFDLTKATACEVSKKLIIFEVVSSPEGAASDEEDGGATAGGAGATGTGDKTNVIGVWIHADKHDTQEVNAAIILKAWEQSRLAVEKVRVEATERNAGGPGWEPGRRLSVTELFNQKNGALR